MQTATQELLDALAAWYGAGAGADPVTDYRLAKDYFHLTPQRVGQWRRAKNGFSNDHIVRICDDMWPGDDAKKIEWLARVAIDREQNVTVKRLWEKVIQQSAASAIICMAVFGGLGSTPAEGSVSTAHNIYYAHSLKQYV